MQFLPTYSKQPLSYWLQDVLLMRYMSRQLASLNLFNEHFPNNKSHNAPLHSPRYYFPVSTKYCTPFFNELSRYTVATHYKPDGPRNESRSRQALGPTQPPIQ